MQQNNSKQSDQSEIELNFIEILRVLLNSKLLIIITTIAVGAIGWLYASYFSPAPPSNFESSAVVEIGSYTAPDEMVLQSRHGRILIASMDASTAQLNASFGLHRSSDAKGGFEYITEYDKLIHRIRIYELDSQFLKIEVVGATFDKVKNKTYEIIDYLKALHDGLLDNVISKKKREIQNVEEKLLTIDKFINLFSEENDLYLSDLAELKLKGIDYKYELADLNRHLNNIEVFKHTDVIGEIAFKTNHPISNRTKLTLAGFIFGFMLASLVVLIRNALAKNYKE